MNQCGCQQFRTKPINAKPKCKDDICEYLKSQPTPEWIVKVSPKADTNQVSNNEEINKCRLPICSEKLIKNSNRDINSSSQKRISMKPNCGENDICDFLRSQPAPEWTKKKKTENQCQKTTNDSYSQSLFVENNNNDKNNCCASRSVINIGTIVNNNYQQRDDKCKKIKSDDCGDDIQQISLEKPPNQNSKCSPKPCPCTQKSEKLEASPCVSKTVEQPATNRSKSLDWCQQIRSEDGGDVQRTTSNKPQSQNAKCAPKPCPCNEKFEKSDASSCKTTNQTAKNNSKLLCPCMPNKPPVEARNSCKPLYPGKPIEQTCESKNSSKPLCPYTPKEPSCENKNSSKSLCPIKPKEQSCEDTSSSKPLCPCIPKEQSCEDTNSSKPLCPCKAKEQSCEVKNSSKPLCPSKPKEQSCETKDNFNPLNIYKPKEQSCDSKNNSKQLCPCKPKESPCVIKNSSKPLCPCTPKRPSTAAKVVNTCATTLNEEENLDELIKCLQDLKSQAPGKPSVSAGQCSTSCEVNKPDKNAVNELLMCLKGKKRLESPCSCNCHSNKKPSKTGCC